jgi:hypothetical protein
VVCVELNQLILEKEVSHFFFSEDVLLILLAGKSGVPREVDEDALAGLAS